MIEIIPAIDLIDGKCVRLIRGDFKKRKIYHDDPTAVAKRFENAGMRRLHLVDLDGAKKGYLVNHPVLEKIAVQTNLCIDFSGGIRSDQDVEIAFSCGAAQVACGSIAVKNKLLFQSWIHRYGAEKFILGADVINEKIAIFAWQDQTEIAISDFVTEYQKRGLSHVLCTEISRDGSLGGPALALYRKLIRDFPQMNFIASGGVSSMDDIEQLDSAGLYGVIIGRAIYEKKIKLEELDKYQIRC